MTDRHFILATAGHVDHGKSALVKALTGTDPDRLPEEKARGISIDLGFACFEVSFQDPTPERFQIGIVDVPGHENFIKNMVTGVGSADLALLVVAANDGWMPQTEEHLQILTYLGVTRAIVAMTKVDFPGVDETGVIQEIRSQLAATPFADAPIVPTSTLSGQGMVTLKARIGESLRTTPLPRDIGKPRLPVDRVFTLRGIGTIVTGTLQGGVFKRGQAVTMQPGGKSSRIRTIHNHNREMDQAGPGMRAALNLADVTVATGTSSSDSSALRRGQVITLAEFGGPSRAANVWLERSPRLEKGAPSAKRPLKHGLRVRIHHGTSNVSGRVLLAASPELGPGESGLAQLRLEEPVFLFLGDRFVVRDWAGQSTLAGGLVLEATADRKDFRTISVRLLCQSRTPTDPVEALRIQLAKARFLRRAAILVQSHFSSMDIEEAIVKLIAASQAVAIGPWLADRFSWISLCSKAEELVDAHHRAHPEEVGIPLSTMRIALEPECAETGVFDILIHLLASAGFIQADGKLKRAAHRPALPDPLKSIGARIREALARGQLNPPSRKELAPDAPGQQAVRFLIQTGEAIELNSELVLRAQDFHFATAVIKKYLTEHASGTVSELRQALGASRRIVVPLLEKLDRAGLTLRQGDVRILTTTARSS